MTHFLYTLKKLDPNVDMQVNTWMQGTNETHKRDATNGCAQR